jgi:hypothetical protein
MLALTVAFDEAAKHFVVRYLLRQGIFLIAPAWYGLVVLSVLLYLPPTSQYHQLPALACGLSSDSGRCSGL